MAEPETRLDKAAARLAGGFATFTAVLAGAGAVGGGLERMIRNYPGWSLVAFGLVVTSIVLATLAVSWFGPAASTKSQTFLVTASFLCFAGSLGVGTFVATQTPQLKDRPRVAATLERGSGGVVLNGTVSANGLKATDHFVVLVTALGPQPDSSLDDELIYWSRTGPDSSGAVELVLEVPVEDQYERVAVEGNVHGSPAEERAFEPGCEAEKLRSGCAVLDVPSSASTGGSAGSSPSGS